MLSLFWVGGRKDEDEAFVEFDGIRMLMYILERRQRVEFVILAPEDAAFRHIFV